MHHKMILLLSFSLCAQLEFGLQTFLKERFKSQTRASVERIVSGTGLSNVSTDKYQCVHSSISLKFCTALDF